MVRYLIIFLILFFCLAFAIEIKVEIKDVLSLERKYFNFSEFKIENEAYNSGSLTFSLRERLTCINDYWSKNYVLYPGDIKLIKIYFVPEVENCTLRYYYGNEIKEENVNLKVTEFKTSNNFKILGARIYKNKIFLEFNSNISGKVILIPRGYYKTWIIEHEEVESRSGYNNVFLNFYYDIAKSFDLEVGFLFNNTLDIKKVKAEKLEGVRYYFYLIRDYLLNLIF